MQAFNFHIIRHISHKRQKPDDYKSNNGVQQLTATTVLQNMTEWPLNITSSSLKIKTMGLGNKIGSSRVVTGIWLGLFFDFMK